MHQSLLMNAETPLFLSHPMLLSHASLVALRIMVEHRLVES
jgi:hypothetical protein